MATLRELLDRVGTGEPVADLAAEFKAAVSTKGYEPTFDSMHRAMVDKEFTLSETFADVEAALMLGRITEEQYTQIRAARLG
jgi:hypothetical protein